MANNTSHYGDAGPILQVDATSLDYDDKGLVVGRAAWRGQKAQRMRAGDAHPYSGGAGLYKWALRYDVGGYIITEGEYIGLIDDPTGFSVEYSSSGQQAPIVTHPDFVKKIGGTRGNPLNLAKFDPHTGAFVEFPAAASNQLQGVTSYLQPIVTARITYFTSNLSSSRIADVGAIKDPPMKLAKTSPKADWLMTGFSYREYATIAYQVTEEYALSGRRGWNRLIYDHA